jgi:hypothetical protein
MPVAMATGGERKPSGMCIHVFQTREVPALYSTIFYKNLPSPMGALMRSSDRGIGGGRSLIRYRLAPQGRNFEEQKFYIK